MESDPVQPDAIEHPPARSVRDVGFTSESSALAARRRAELAREAREARRVAVESGLAVGLEKCVKLGLDLVEDAAAERLKLEPDAKVMERGRKAAESILDRLVPKVARVEGEITHNHLFELLAERVRAARGDG